jgi:4'-phosphopantetheinyl transferase
MTGEIVEVWLMRTDPPHPVLAGLETLLDEAERGRADALLLADHRRRFVAAHGAVRVIIGHRLGTPPADLRWHYGPHGKPELADPATGVHFSLSRSDELAALALCDRRRVGVDIQKLPADLDATRMSARFYPPDEVGFVTAATGHDGQLGRFIRLWTRKEACLKVAGGRPLPGLKLSVRGADQISTGQIGTGQISTGQIVVSDPGGPLPGPYLVQDIPAPPGFCASVAIDGSMSYRVRWRCWPADQPSTAGRPSA